MNNRILLDDHPYPECGEKTPLYAGDWPCSWISTPNQSSGPQVAAYRLRFSTEKEETIRIHVSGDERYILYLNGQQIGRGSERGAPHHWFYESYDLKLASGDHLLTACVWHLGSDLRPAAQMSIYPGFILGAEGEWVSRIGTGNAAWETKELGGYEFHKPVNAWGSGANVSIRADEFDWGFHLGNGEGWEPARPRHPGLHPNFKEVDVDNAHIMQPATLPAMMHSPTKTGTVRFIEEIETTDATKLAGEAVSMERHLAPELNGWRALLQEGASLEVPPNTRRRVIIDLDDYYCAYPSLTLTGGKEASIELCWAESLYHELETEWDAPLTFIYDRDKGNRDEIDQKFFIGESDRFLPDGSASRTFESLWWQAGRYLQFIIETKEDPVTIEDFTLYETRYPLDIQSSFSSDDEVFQEVLPIMQRAIETGSHETYFDCPYYEQMMYTGDTRLETLVTYSLTKDSRLPEKALRTFDISRRHNGLTQARYPSDRWVDLPPFSLYWTNMVYDYSLWRGNRELIESYLPGVRAILDAWCQNKDASGAVYSPGRWNFVDWVRDDGWEKGGLPPEAEDGLSSILNWHLAYSFEKAAQLEAHTGEPEMEQLYHRRAKELAEAMTTLFWNEEHGLFADNVEQTYYSEHAQCFALLSGLTTEAQRAQIEKGLESKQNLARATIYFSHYYLEACRELNRMDLFFERLNIWKSLPEIGMKTTYEMPGRSRSDNHAWGTHPYYHCFASILGIRPAEMGYRTVHIKPQLGHLNEASGKAIHPNGFIEAAFQKKDGKLTGEISLPDDVKGTLELNGEIISLPRGVKNFKA